MKNKNEDEKCFTLYELICENRQQIEDSKEEMKKIESEANKKIENLTCLCFCTLGVLALIITIVQIIKGWYYGKFNWRQIGTNIHNRFDF